MYFTCHCRNKIPKKRQVDNPALSEPEREFEVRNNKEYKVEAIIDSAIYNYEVETYLLDLYYLVLWKSYLEKENT